MEKKEQLLVISPKKELIFSGRSNQALKSYMILENQTEHPIWFLIKSSDLTRYIAFPNHGIVQPKNRLEVGVVRQPYSSDESEEEHNKFIVQSLEMKNKELNATEMYNKVISGEFKEELMETEKRIILQFVPLSIKPEHGMIFLGRSNQVLKSNMILENQTEHPIWFFIKSSDLTRYIAFPNHGIVQPKNRLEVGVVRQPYSSDESEEEHNKFIVQSLEMKSKELNATEMYNKLISGEFKEELVETEKEIILELEPDVNDGAQAAGANQSSGISCKIYALTAVAAAFCVAIVIVLRN